MTYRHKREKCAKETREILENIIRGKSDRYALLDEGQKVEVSNPVKNAVESTEQVNVMPSESDQAIEKETTEFSHDETKAMGDYRPHQDIGDPESEIEKVVQRDRKRRNYVNLRDEYEKK